MSTVNRSCSEHNAIEAKTCNVITSNRQCMDYLITSIVFNNSFSLVYFNICLTHYSFNKNVVS